jgi:hypothetical protein
MILNHEEYYSEIMGDASVILEKYTLQLYLYEEGKPPIPASSSVLIKTKDNHYLITAAHVLVHNPRDTVFILDPGNGAITVSGVLIHSEIDKNEVSNRTDIAIIQLADVLLPIIATLQKEFFDITHYNLDSYPEDDFYIVYGYPNSKTKFIGSKKTIQTAAFKFLTMKSDKPIKNLDKPWTLQVMFTRNKVTRLKTKEINKAANPRGLSGCGVWTFENVIYQKEDKPKLLLKAILIEYEKDRSLFVCTKMNMIAQLLINRFNESLPKPLSLSTLNIS